MTQPAPIKLHYEYDGKIQYLVLTANVVLQEVAQTLETFSPDSLEHSQNFLADIVHKLQRIQESARLDCQCFESYSNQKQTEYEAGLKKLQDSRYLFVQKYLQLGAVWDSRKKIWEELGYSWMIPSCTESAQQDLYRIPRLLIDPPLESYPINSTEAGVSYFKNNGFKLFVPAVKQIYLEEKQINESDIHPPWVREGVMKKVAYHLNIYAGFARQLNDIYSIFKSHYCGTEIASTNQVFRFFSYVEKRINLLISKVELIQEQGKIAGSLSEDIFRQELGNSFLDLINVINLKVQETQAR